jgi:hypothetical protein
MGRVVKISSPCHRFLHGWSSSVQETGWLRHRLSHLQGRQDVSAWGAQPSQSDRDHPANGSFRRQAAGPREGVEAEARKLVRCHITPDVTVLYGVDQQFSHHVVDLVLRSRDSLASME